MSAMMQFIATSKMSKLARSPGGMMPSVMPARQRPFWVNLQGHLRCHSDLSTPFTLNDLFVGTTRFVTHRVLSCNHCSSKIAWMAKASGTADMLRERESPEAASREKTSNGSWLL